MFLLQRRSLVDRVIQPGVGLLLASLAVTATGCGGSSGAPGSGDDSGARVDARTTTVTDSGASASHRADARRDVDAADAGSAVKDAGRPDVDAGRAPVDAKSTTPDAALDAGATDACPDAAGALILYAIPPPATLDWTSPNSLLNTALESSAAGEALIYSGQAVLSHEIGHVNLELDCGATSIPLTGQTGGGAEWQSGADGVGIMFRDYPGSLNEWDDAIGDNADTVKDIAARQASGNLTQIKFVVNQAMCQRLKDFHDEYVATMAYTSYDGLDRARRFEGAGCAIFGAAFVDVGGLLRRSVFTPVWARWEFVGSARYANTDGTNPFYLYGSNAQALDSSGVSWMWPAGVNLPASQSSPIVPEGSVMDSWTGPEDTPFSIPGVTLTGPLVSAVPFTLYDPAMIEAWAEGVWSLANTAGSAASLGGTWTAQTVKKIHQITYDAHCVMPQTIAFDADNDDLFKDSDAP